MQAPKYATVTSDVLMEWRRWRFRGASGIGKGFRQW